MEIIVSGKHVEITDSIRAYAMEKAGKLPRYYDRISTVEVLADRSDRHTYEIELVAHVDGHEHFVATGRHDDLYAAVDAAADKLTRQIHDYKERRRDSKKHSPA